ncbi:hypothetical protein ABRZ24_21115, partial [Brenneria populi]|nr:hypothetical protein [Brenneria populi Li et al. 2015]
VSPPVSKSVLTKIALSQHPKVVINKGFSQWLSPFLLSMAAKWRQPIIHTVAIGHKKTCFRRLDIR